MPGSIAKAKEKVNISENSNGIWAVMRFSSYINAKRDIYVAIYSNIFVFDKIVTIFTNIT